MRAASIPFALVLVAAAVAGVSSCNVNPVHDTLVKSLGGEAAGVPTGEFHRAGQPCLACHGGDGPANQEFSIAGTIFWGPNAAIGCDQANVGLIDSLGATYVATTNCVGNFFITPSDWQPAFPVLVAVQKDGTKYSQTMLSQISRAGSCAECHKDPLNYDARGHVYVTTTDQTDPLPADCPVDPQLSSPGGLQ